MLKNACKVAPQSAQPLCCAAPHSPPSPPLPPPLPQTKTVMMRVEKVSISNTRSAHEDTDFVSCYIRLVNGNTTVASQTNFVGDRNNGDFAPGPNGGALACEATVLPTDTVEVGFAIVNNGHGSDDAQDAIQAVVTAIGTLADSYFPLSSAIAAAADIGIGLLFANCDGLVAADKEVGKLASAFPNAAQGSVPLVRTYPGTDSPAGCGSNSVYTVTWDAYAT